MGVFDLGAVETTVFEKVYPHVLDDANAIVDWMSGTALVPYRERLTQTLFDSFRERYRALVAARYPGSPVFFGFRRILFCARKPVG